MDLGAIIRNSGGEVMAAMSKKIVIFSPAMIEAKALEVSQLQARNIHLPLVIAESDSLSVVNQLNSGIVIFIILSDLLKDVSHLLPFFGGTIVNYVYRSTNKAAHGFARYALRLDDKCI